MESAYNGEPPTCAILLAIRRAIPWEVCRKRDQRVEVASASDPVTTVACSHGGSSCLNGKFMTATTRRPLAFGRAGWRYSLRCWKTAENVRCRLVASWGWSRSQGLGCSPIKAVRELGLERRETVRSLSAVGVGDLRRVDPSTRGPG